MKTAKALKSVITLPFILLMLLIVLSAVHEARADCKPAKSYIITMNGGGYSIAGKLSTSSQTLVGDYVDIPAKFIGSKAYTREESYERPVSVTGIGFVNFAANCDMNVEISINGLQLAFTSYSDDSSSANGVLIGAAIPPYSEKATGFTGGIRISAK
jgi:hypothetical protein